MPGSKKKFHGLAIENCVCRVDDRTPVSLTSLLFLCNSENRREEEFISNVATIFWLRFGVEFLLCTYFKK